MYRLPESWSSAEVLTDILIADGVRLHRAGVSTRSAEGEEICGAAAATEGPELDRAWYELLERVATIEASAAMREVHDLRRADGTRLGCIPTREAFPTSDAPQRWRYARSNGVALHRGWSRACERALWELAERDRVLRCWRGELAPVRLLLPPTALPATTSYEWRAYDFPSHEAAFSASLSVVGVFGFPRAGDLPFLLGFAGRRDLATALTAASREALQLMAFLWGEPLPDPNAISRVPTAGCHLDLFQVPDAHRIVRDWLDGAHLRYGRYTEWKLARGLPSDSRVGFVDLTPSWLDPELRVVKAVCAEWMPLVFGDSPWTEHLPPELRLHHIP